MTIELWMLVVSGILVIVQGFVTASAKNKQNDFKGDNFQRDKSVELSGWGGRAERSLYNYFEYLPLFIILVIAAHLTGANNSMTALGAELFVAGRIVHLIFYITGPGALRSIGWLIAVIGLILIGLQL